MTSLLNPFKSKKSWCCNFFHLLHLIHLNFWPFRYICSHDIRICAFGSLKIPMGNRFHGNPRIPSARTLAITIVDFASHQVARGLDIMLQWFVFFGIQVPRLLSSCRYLSAPILGTWVFVSTCTSIGCWTVKEVEKEICLSNLKTCCQCIRNCSPERCNHQLFTFDVFHLA